MDRFPERSALSSKVKSSTSQPPSTARGAMAMAVKSQRRHCNRDIGRHVDQVPKDLTGLRIMVAAHALCHQAI